MRFRSEHIEELKDDGVLEARTVGSGEVTGTVTLPVEPELWRGVDELRAEILLTSAASGTIGCAITASTRSDGFDENDGYWLTALVSPRG